MLFYSPFRCDFTECPASSDASFFRKNSPAPDVQASCEKRVEIIVGTWGQHSELMAGAALRWHFRSPGKEIPAVTHRHREGCAWSFEKKEGNTTLNSSVLWKRRTAQALSSSQFV